MIVAGMFSTNILVLCTTGSIHSKVRSTAISVAKRCNPILQGAAHRNICSRQVKPIRIKVQSTEIFIAKRFNHGFKVQSTAIFVTGRLSP
jgi:hypothetical protein